MEIDFKASLWKWSGQVAWFFITLPEENYEDIKQISSFMDKKSFGSVRVEVKIGKTSWQTSIFPDSKTKTYLLPVKREIRANEGLKTGNKVRVSIKLATS